MVAWQVLGAESPKKVGGGGWSKSGWVQRAISRQLLQLAGADLQIHVQFIIHQIPPRCSKGDRQYTCYIYKYTLKPLRNAPSKI